MRKATIDDAKSLGFQLEGLTNPHEELLRVVSDTIKQSGGPGSAKPKSKSHPNQSMASSDIMMLAGSSKRAPGHLPGGMRNANWSVDDTKEPRSPSPEADMRMLDFDDVKKLHHSAHFGHKMSYPYSMSQPMTREQSQFSDSGLSQAWSIQSEKAHAQFSKKLIVSFISCMSYPYSWCPLLTSRRSNKAIVV